MYNLLTPYYKKAEEMSTDRSTTNGKEEQKEI